MGIDLLNWWSLFDGYWCGDCDGLFCWLGNFGFFGVGVVCFVDIGCDIFWGEIWF